jgi:hypothetical protein
VTLLDLTMIDAINPIVARLNVNEAFWTVIGDNFSVFEAKFRLIKLQLKPTSGSSNCN